MWKILLYPVGNTKYEIPAFGRQAKYGTNVVCPMSNIELRKKKYALIFDMYIEQEDKKNSPSKAKIYFNKSSEYLGITPPFSVPAGLSEKERMDYIKNRNIGNDKKFFVPLGINYIYYE